MSKYTRIITGTYVGNGAVKGQKVYIHRGKIIKIDIRRAEGNPAFPEFYRGFTGLGRSLALKIVSPDGYLIVDGEYNSYDGFIPVVYEFTAYIEV